jgi:TolB-like protein/DNA-binding winged helix-turn-helix (wHTH) protein/Flp pilus assembly protein TadD
MKLLEILLERPGELVTREDLRRRVWPNESFGDFDQAVNVAIAKLRNALGDSAENPRYIETLPKRGYRFIAAVTVLGNGSSSSPKPETNLVTSHDVAASAASSGNSIASARPARRRYAMFVVASLLFLVLATLAWWWSHSRFQSKNQIRSLAVLPLDNLSGDESQNYFADGMTDELITDLAQIGALRVVSRTSVMQYKNSRKPLPQIARELNVDAVVEGSVLRAGQQVRITAQLIHAPADEHLWAHSYEGDLRDTLALQKKVARAIAEQIRIELTPREQAALKSARAVDPVAYEAYLRGRFFWNKRTAESLKKAIDYFNQAVEKDPKYAEAYSGLADSYALAGDWQYSLMAPKDALPKAKAAATKALELDDSLGEAHASLGFSIDLFDWDWPAAEREFRRAIELSPGYATAHHWYSWHLAVQRRNDEAIAEIKKALALDPLSLIVNADLAEELLIAHRYQDSIQQARKTIEMDPNFAVAHYVLGQALVQTHVYEEGIAELETAVKLSGRSPICTSHLAYAYAVSGRRDDALRILNELKKDSTGSANAPELALAYVGVGDNQEALNWLEKAYEDRFNPSILLRPCFDPLRSTQRFQDLMRRMGLAL